MKKFTFNHISIFIIFIAVVLLTSCATTKKSTDLRPQEARTVTILAVNDMHAAIDNFPRFGYMVDSLRAIYPDLLLVSAGDSQTGNPINDQYPEKGMPIIELMNMLKFDLSAVGNHEFDTKPDGFANILKKSEFDHICGNVEVENTKKYPIKPYKIITTTNGVRVAFASVLDINPTGIPDTHPENVKGFKFLDPVETAKKHLKLKDSADVLIYLTHYGFENDVKLANLFPKGVVDVIIGGHSHTKIEKEQLHNGVLITQAERKLKYATLLKLSVDATGKVSKSMELLTVDNEGKERADLRAKVDEFNNNPAMRVRIAEAADDFKNYEQIGYLMVDALRVSTGTDIALINPGGVRIDRLPKGAVSVMDIYSMDPFGNEIVLFKLTGHELMSLIKNAYSFDEYLPIYPSGMKTKYLLGKDGEVKTVELFDTKGKPMDLNKVYTVSMNNYMASVYVFDHKDPGTGLFRPTAESMIDYLKELKYIPSYKNEKRVEIVR